MRVMVFMVANADTEIDMSPTPEMVEAFAEMDRYNEELVAAGVMVAGAGLKPPADGKRVAFNGPGRRTVIDGPFAESREVVAGFSIWEVKDMAEAVAWARRAPDPLPGFPATIEIRPFYEVSDLADLMTPEELSAPRDGERGRLGMA